MSDDFETRLKASFAESKPVEDDAFVEAVSRRIAHARRSRLIGAGVLATLALALIALFWPYISAGIAYVAAAPGDLSDPLGMFLASPVGLIVSLLVGGVVVYFSDAWPWSRFRVRFPRRFG